MEEEPGGELRRVRLPIFRSRSQAEVEALSSSDWTTLEKES
uniref:Uncharacterized protein n=1 Tax=Arundo donax TaxID=35708 RepID=A0A0A8ZUV9_ARUDO